jgi:type II secretory pathway pseudopilin PulG
MSRRFGARDGPAAIGARGRSRGAALLLTMFLVAVIGILLTVAGRVWHTEMQRDREAELLWVGSAYARAIAGYYAASPAPLLQYPEKLNQLLLDVRQPNTVRHLRRLYRDPITGSTEWGLLKDASGHITGVYSLAKGEPLKQAGFAKAQEKFNGAKTYADWKFIAEAGQGAAGAAAGAVPGAIVPGTPAPGTRLPLPTAPE